MSNQTSIIAEAPSSSSIPAALVHGAEWGIVLLLVAGMSHFVNRKRSAAAAGSRAVQRSAAIPNLHFSQPLQWISYGKQLERSQQYAEAVAIYDQGLSHYPNDFHLWHERGLALAKLQQFEAAIASYNRAYQIRPEQRDLAHERGDALLQLGRYQEAIASFDIFLQYVPSNTHVLADRGYALFQLGCYEEAVRSLESVLKANRWEGGSRAHAHYYYIEALRQSGQVEAALRAAKQAISQHPEERFKAQYAALKQQLSHS
ncbi:MAG TPA: tetratricopeptide repeat protein [Coleofasciculaceae cyanobacterium]